MIACLRPLSTLCLAGLLVACASSPTSNLGELPRTPQASIEQLLQQAGDSQSEQANLLRLSAADLAYQQKKVRPRRRHPRPGETERSQAGPAGLRQHPGCGTGAGARHA